MPRDRTYGLCTVDNTPAPGDDFPPPPDLRAHWSKLPITKKRETLCGLDADAPTLDTQAYELCPKCVKKMDRIQRRAARSAPTKVRD